LLILKVDRFSDIRKLVNKEFPIVEEKIILRTSYELDELINNIKNKDIVKKYSIIWWGSNRFHFLTLPLYVIRGFDLPYLHIDLHPDDYQI